MRKNIMNREDIEKENEEERYRFVREQIMPQKKQKAVRFLYKLGTTVILALVFGVLGGLSFVAVTELFSSETSANGGTEGDTVTSMETDSLPGDTVSAMGTDGNSGESASYSLEQYKALSEEMAAVGSRCNPFIVSVSQSGDSSWLSGEGQNTPQCGVLFQETYQEYRVLTTTQGISAEKKTEVSFLDGRSVSAEVLGTDTDLGIVVLKIQKEDVSEETQAVIKVADFAGSSSLSLGTPLIALGCPDGVMYSVKCGSVINDSMKAEIIDGEVSLYGSDLAYCSGGNAILVSIKGKVVGITTNAFNDVSGENGMAFLGTSDISPIIQGLAEGREKAYLGIRGCDVEEDCLENLGVSEGVYVTEVISRSPAYEGNMRVTDVIVQINDQKISNLKQLYECLLTLPSDEKISVTVKRQVGKSITEKELQVVLQ